jgi:hypothetical protein
MPRKYQIAIGAVVVLSLADSLHTRIKMRKNALLFIKAGQVFEAHQRSDRHQVLYLQSLLSEHDIEIDEFDLIALNYHT